MTKHNKTKSKPKAKANAKKDFIKMYHKLQPSKELIFAHSDGGAETNTFANAVHVTRLDDCIQGTALNERMRSAIHMSYLHVRGGCVKNNTTKARGIRMLVIRERNHNKLNTTTFADLFQIVNGYTTTAPSQFDADGAMRVNKEQYITLFDKVFSIPIESEGSLVVNEKIRLNQLQYYTRNAGTNTATRGQIYFITCLFEPDNTKTATTSPIEFALRVFFKDYNKPV